MKLKILRLFIPRHFSVRVILLTVSASFATLIITVVLSYSHNKNFLNEVLHDTIQQNSAIINEKLGEAIVYKDIYTMFRSAESSIKSSEFLKNVYVLDENNEYVTDALSLRKLPTDINNKNFLKHPVTLGENNKIVGFLIYETDPQYIVNFALEDSVRIGLSEIIFFVFLVLVVSFFTGLLVTPMKVLNSYVEGMDLVNLERNIHLPWYASKEIAEIANNLMDISVRLSLSVKKNIEQEKQIMASSKLASIGMMSSGLAHELKNPAMTVLLIAKTLGKELDDKYSKDIEYLVKETNKMVRIVNEFLDIAKPIKIDLKTHSFNSLVEIINQYVYVNFYNKVYLQVKNYMEEDFICTDIERLTEVFINLINNSAEAGADFMRIDFYGKDENIIIEYSDNGFGIPEENIDKIFLPFFTTKSSGTGLGLFYIESIINALGGTIFVASDTSGSTFTIKLKRQSVGKNTADR